MGQDNSQSWVRISCGTNKYVIESNQNNIEIPANPHEDQAPRTSVKVIATRSKAKAKPQWEPVDTPTIIPTHERKWIDIEPSEPTLASYEVSKKVISLLRHNQTVKRKKMEQFNSSSSKYSSQVQHWSDRVGNLVWQQQEVKKGDISIALTIREQTFTCKEYTSYYRKLATETIQIQQEQRQKH